MSRILILNAFSLNMLGSGDIYDLRFSKVGVEDFLEVISGKDVTNAIGHPQTYEIVNQILGGVLPSPVRMTVTLDVKDTIFIIQYRGPRLEEGVTKLPEGAVLEWWRVDFRD